MTRDGSPDAASYSSMNNVLHEWGVIESPQLTRPLRMFSDAEVLELRRRLADMPRPKVRLATAR